MSAAERQRERMAAWVEEVTLVGAEERPNVKFLRGSERALLAKLLRAAPLVAETAPDEKAHELVAGSAGVWRPLVSDAKLRAEIRDLKARLETAAAAQKAHNARCLCAVCRDARAATNLKIKNWRKP